MTHTLSSVRRWRPAGLTAAADAPRDVGNVGPIPLPAYQDLLANDPDRLCELVGSDVDGRVDDHRLLERTPGILHDLATDWQYRR